MTLVDGYDRTKNPRTATYRAMTLDEGKALTYGEHVAIRARDGTARTVKVNGKPKTWKRDLQRCEIPCKYGMYEYATFTWLQTSQVFHSPTCPSAILVVADDGEYSNA